MKAVIFARVSTQEQEADGHSIDAQIAKLREYCNRNDLEVIKEYEVVESSTKGEKPEFYKMIEFVNAGKQQFKDQLLITESKQFKHQAKTLSLEAL